MAEKHGQSTVNIFVAFTTGDDCYEADLAKGLQNQPWKTEYN